ncbi:MAG: BamA/TamA family outer membrane protein [Kiritimatiellae bacterium]|nr:BamA/TamA family outer membrane protein [Kiritimatiellia bacterium]
MKNRITRIAQRTGRFGMLSGLIVLILPGHAPAEKPAENLHEKEGAISLVGAPAISSSPGFGNGLGGVGLLFFRPDASDTVSPNSSLTALGLYSDTDSYFLGAFCPLYLKEDRWRVSPGLVRGRVRSDLNIGLDRSARFDDDFLGGFLKVLHQVKGNWYAGGAFSVMDHRYTARNEQADSYFSLYDVEDVTSGMLSAVAAFDSRNDQRYPTRGQNAECSLGWAPDGLAEGDAYTTVQATWAVYHEFARRHVVAAQMVGRTVSEDAPYYERPTLGQRGDLRGYTPGEIVGEHSLSGQVELRSFFTERLGGVVFGGVGALWENGLSSKDVYPSFGLGLRFRLQQENKVSFRVDYAVGEADQDGWYVSVAEAF